MVDCLPDEVLCAARQLAFRTGIDHESCLSHTAEAWSTYEEQGLWYTVAFRRCVDQRRQESTQNGDDQRPLLILDEMIGDKEASPKIDFLVATDEAGYSEVETTMDLVERLGNLPDEELAELFRHYWLNMPDKRHSTRATLRAKALRHARREGYIQPTELQLSPREVTVLTLYAQGMTHPQIAEELGLSPLTIKSHFRRVNQRLQAKNTTHSVVIALTSGWITVP